MAQPRDRLSVASPQVRSITGPGGRILYSYTAMSVHVVSALTTHAGRCAWYSELMAVPCPLV